MKRLPLIFLFFLFPFIAHEALANGSLSADSETSHEIQTHLNTAVVGNPLQTISRYQLFILNELASVKEILEETNLAIAHVQQSEHYIDENDRDHEARSTYLELLYSLHETLSSLERVKADMERHIEEYRILIDRYVSNALFEKKSHEIPEKVTYEDIKKAIQTMESLEDSLKKIRAELEESYKERQTRENLLKNTEEVLPEKIKIREGKRSLSKKVETLMLRLHAHKKLLSQALLKEKEFEIRILETKKSILKEELKINREGYKLFRDRLRISEKYLEKFILQQKGIQKGLMEKKEQLLPQIEAISMQINSAEETLERENDHKNSKQILETLGQQPYPRKLELIRALVSLLLMETKRDFIEIQLGDIQAQIKYSQRNIKILTAWEFANSSKKIDERNLKRHLASLEVEVMQAEIEELSRKKSSLATALQEQSTLHASLRQSLHDHSSSLANKTKDATELEFIETLMQERYDILMHAIEICSQDIILTQELIYQSKWVIQELKMKSFWTRSQHSIGMAELETFIPDMKLFARTCIVGFIPFLKQCYSVLTFKKKLAIAHYIKFILGLIVALLIGFCSSIFVPRLQSSLAWLASHTSYAGRAHLFLSFLIREGYVLYAWFASFILFKFCLVPSPYAGVLFYLASVPYLIITAFRFFTWFASINAKRGYIFLGSDYATRFIIIVSGLTYASIIIYFTREAFLKSGIIHSHVPTILLAAHFIILQIALILLLRKDQLLHLISEENVFGSWFKSLLNEYYLIFLVGIITIIIMSNPYVGYGSQVLYVLSRLALTALIIPLFSKVHDAIKHRMSDLFFYQTEQDTLQNRIPGGRGWYALFVLCSFIGLAAVCYFTLWRIWGIEVHFSNLKKYLEFNLLGSTHNAQSVDSLTILDLGRVLVFIVGGYISAFLINSFILRRIFTPILVGTGVQNTVVTLSRYIIVTCGFLLGLHSAGLESLTTKIFAVIVGIGFAIKEPVADLISYFILLVQRPIKVGDLVRISISSEEREITGIVRQITPRATLIRQRNSQTVIVPNSILLTRAVINWNYIRGFVATEDIILTVGFSQDPEQVRTLLLKAVETHPAVLKNPAPIIWCNNFTAAGYQFMVRGYVASDRAADHWEISSQIRILLVKKLRQANITLSAPYHFVEITRTPETTESRTDLPKQEEE